MKTLTRVGFLVTLLAGCTPGANIQTAADAYRRGDLETAARECRSAGDKLDDHVPSVDSTRARYLAFCGLVHWKRGEREPALELLSASKHDIDAAKANGEPAWIGPDVIAEVERALAELQAAPKR